MTRVLVIEDQPGTIELFKEAITEAGSDVVLVEPAQSGIEDLELGEGEAYEIQLARFLKDIAEREAIDLALVDTDLSRGRHLEASSLYRVALAAVGLPVCRYQKRGSTSRLDRLPALRRSAQDGASAIWVPNHLVGQADMDGLPQWLTAVAAGFRTLRNGLAADPQLLDRSARLSPADVLAAVMGRPEAAADFVGYAGQNQRFFVQNYSDEGFPAVDPAMTFGTRLGYWLFNYIMMFPGPILRAREAAAFLNVEPSQADDVHLGAVLAATAYTGPFCDVEPLYWRPALAELVEECRGDIANHPGLAGTRLRRVDPAHVAQPAYICMLSGDAITDAEAGPTPDWVPSGASEARFKAEHLDELGPLVGM